MPPLVPSESSGEPATDLGQHAPTHEFSPELSPERGRYARLGPDVAGRAAGGDDHLVSCGEWSDWGCGEVHRVGYFLLGSSEEYI